MRQEIPAGIAMGVALIPGLTVVPTLLVKTGMDFAGAYAACVLASLLAVMLLGFCRLPVAAAPGAAVTGWLAYVVILSHGHSWQAVLGASFLSSVLCLIAVWLLRKCDWREFVPHHLSESLTCGLALMLVLLGLRQGHVIVSAPVGFFTIGDLADPVAFHSLLGLLVTAVLMACRVPGAILWGMLLVGGVSLIQGFWIIPAAPFLFPSLEKTAFQMDLPGAMALPDIILSLVILELVLLKGTMTALRQKIKGRAAAAVFGANAAGALMGSFPLVPAPESAAGIGCGGRGRLCAFSAAGVLAVFLCCEPLAAEMASYGAITSPALVLSGCLLLRRVSFPSMDRLSEFLSACAVSVLLPVTQSIALGFGSGVVIYVFLALWEGRRQELSPAILITAAVFCVLFSIVS